MHVSLPQAIFFDLDGTLIDSVTDLGAAADQLRTDRGLPSLPVELYRPMAGAGARGMLKVALGMSPEHADYEVLREEFYRNYESALTQRTAAFAGVAQLLATLGARRIPWGIVTNKSKRFTQPLVAQMPLLQGAAVVISGDSTAHTKPHPAPLLAAAQALGVDAKNCWYVGDDRRDMEAAQAAGMLGIAAAWGYLGEHAIESWGAAYIAHEPLHVLQALENFS